MTTAAPLVTPTPLVRRGAEELADYLSDLAVQLLRYGCPAYRVEQLIVVVAGLEGHDGEAFALPTCVFLSVRPLAHPGARPSLRMTRVQDRSVNLDRLLAVDAIFNEVAEHKLRIESARTALHALDASAPTYPRAAKWAAVVLTAGAAAVFFRGNLLDVGLASLVALANYGVGRLLERHPSGKFLQDFVGALLASLTAFFATQAFPTATREVIVLSGLISLMPGMTFTTALAELAQKHLVCGSARLMEALVTFLSLVFGIALSLGIARYALPDATVGRAREALGLPFQLAALVAMAMGFAVSLSVPKRFLWAALLSGATSYGVTAIATRQLPGYAASFVAAIVVCTLANALARLTNRPAQLYQLPGMMLLVPGSFGFLSLDDFLVGKYLDGAGHVLSMALIGGGLVMGVLLANVLCPPRKLL